MTEIQRQLRAATEAACDELRELDLQRREAEDRSENLERQLAEATRLLAEERERFDWFFSTRPRKDPAFAVEYMRGIHEKWPPDKWRAVVDAAKEKS